MTPAQLGALRLATWKAAADRILANEAEAAKPSLPRKPQETEDGAK